MKILFDARPLVDARSGGVARVALELVKAFAENYPADYIYCFTTGFKKISLPEAIINLKNIRHVHLKIPNKLWAILSWLNLVSIIRQTEKRVGKMDQIFFPNLGFMGNCRGQEYALLLHDLSFLIEPKWYSLKQRIWHRLVKAKKLIHGAKKIFTVSETSKRDAIRLLGIPENKLTVIPIGSTLKHISSNPTRNPSPETPRTPYPVSGTQYPVLNTRFILALGANDPRKNSTTAIQAVATLKQEPGYEDLKMILIGQSYAVLSTQYNIEWLHAIEHPSDAELATLFSNAVVFLYPSWYEGYGLPLHEAASFGTPCIASTSGALPETAPNGTIFANPAKPHHWAEAIKIALTKNQEPCKIDGQAWTKAAEIIKNTIIAS